jgi:hypothetical protein
MKNVSTRPGSVLEVPVASGYFRFTRESGDLLVRTAFPNGPQTELISIIRLCRREPQANIEKPKQTLTSYQRFVLYFGGCES